MKHTIRRIGRRLPRRYKNLLLQNRLSRFLVWRVYGFVAVEPPQSSSVNSVSNLLLNRAIDDMLIELRLLSIRVKILEEKIESEHIKDGD